MKNNIKEIVTSIALVVISVLLINPLNFWMPTFLVMCMLFIVFVLFIIFAIFILREKIIDERDAMHRTLAGRNAFLAGSFVLVLGIIIQELSESLDIWLVLALVVMILVKVGTRIWTDRNM